MEKLKEALKVLDSIDPKDDLEHIKEKALKAYDLSSRCLDAVILLSRLERSYLSRVKLLEEALEKEDLSVYTLPLDDSFLSRQFLRFLKELLDLYLAYNDLVKARKLVSYIITIKRENIYHIKEDALILSVYFNDEITYQKLSKEELDPFVKALAAYIHDLENGCDFKDELTKLIDVYDLRTLLLKEEEGDSDPLRHTLARYAFLINRSYLTIRLLLGEEDA